MRLFFWQVFRDNGMFQIGSQSLGAVYRPIHLGYFDLGADWDFSISFEFSGVHTVGFQSANGHDSFYRALDSFDWSYGHKGLFSEPRGQLRFRGNLGRFFFLF